MSLVEETLGDVMVHAHTFRFITPASTQTPNVPNPCTLCHKDKSIEWAEQTLSAWTERSPGEWEITLGRLLEDSPAGEERGAVRAFRHREKLLTLVVKHGPAIVSGDDRPDTA
jgi:hypothetical protein